MWGKGSSTAVRNGSKYLVKNSRFAYDTGYCDLYGHFFESHAMRLRGGDEWALCRDLLGDQLVVKQEADGSWPVPGGGKQPRAVAAAFVTDALYRACLCTLILEAPYRVAP
jgi:hypothetical protein